MRFTCEKCGSTDFQNIRGRHFCTKCDREINSENETLSLKEESLFVPKETDSILLSQQDSRDVDVINNVSKSPTTGSDIPSTNRTSKPIFCYHCGHKLVCNSSHQVNFCDQCGVQQMGKEISSLELNESEYVLPHGITIPNSFGRSNLTYFNNSFQNTPPSAFSSPPNFPVSSAQDIPGRNQFTNNIDEQMSSPPQRSSFSGTPYERPSTSPTAVPSRSPSFPSTFPFDNRLTHLNPPQSQYSGLPLDTTIMERSEVDILAKSPSTCSSISSLSSSDTSLEHMQQHQPNTLGMNLFTVPENSIFDFVPNITIDNQTEEMEANIDLKVDKNPSSFLSRTLPNDMPHLQFLLNGDISIEKPHQDFNLKSSCLEETLPCTQLQTAGRKIVVEADEYGDTTLHRYIQKNKANAALSELKRLVEYYVNDKETFLRSINKRNERGEVALQNAIKKQNIEVIENLLENGVDVTVLDHNGNNILHLVILASPIEQIALSLLRVVFNHRAFYQEEFKSLLNEQSKAYNNDGFTVLHEVTKRKYGDTLRFLKENGANLNIVSRREKTTAIVMAAKQRNWSIVDILCSLDACVNIPTSSGWYPVHAAIEDGDKKRLEFFMEHGVDIYGYLKIETSEEIRQLCDKYMRRRRRKTAKSDRGLKRRRRCNCGSDEGHIS